MWTCADCRYFGFDPEFEKYDCDPWVCTLTGEKIDPEGECKHIEVLEF